MAILNASVRKEWSQLISSKLCPFPICTVCSGAPDCTALNREPCSDVANTCGACFERHLGEEGFSNQPCFDPCIDGVMNFDETDVDCGGALCPSCQLGDVSSWICRPLIEVATYVRNLVCST